MIIYNNDTIPRNKIELTTQNQQRKRINYVIQTTNQNSNYIRKLIFYDCVSDPPVDEYNRCEAIDINADHKHMLLSQSSPQVTNLLGWGYSRDLEVDDSNYITRYKLQTDIRTSHKKLNINIVINLMNAGSFTLLIDGNPLLTWGASSNASNNTAWASAYDLDVFKGTSGGGYQNYQKVTTYIAKEDLTPQLWINIFDPTMYNAGQTLHAQIKLLNTSNSAGSIVDDININNFKPFDTNYTIDKIDNIYYYTNMHDYHVYSIAYKYGA